jgi:hemolysin activation/secretion protein
MWVFLKKGRPVILCFIVLAIALFSSAVHGGEPAPESSKAVTPLTVEQLPTGTEPRINSVIIRGNAHYREAFLEKRIEAALDHGILKRAAFSRMIMLLNSLPDFEAKASLVPSPPQGYDLILSVDDRKNTHFRLGYDNFGTVSSGENRMIYELGRSSLMSCGDLLLLKLIEPLGVKSATSQYYVTYSLPLSVTGARMSIAASSIDTLIPGTPSEEEMEGLEGYELIRNSEIYTLSFFSPLERARALSSDMICGFTTKHYGEHQRSSELDTDDEVRFFFLGFNREEKHGPLSLSYSMLASQGVGTFFGGMADNSPLSRREEVYGKYTKLNGSFLLRQALGKRSSLNIRGAGQISNSRLAISEEFPIGGPDSVRGYAKNEYRGDDGFYMNVEYRHQLLPPRGKKSPLEALLFYDLGSVKVINPLLDERPQVSLRGGGLGFRIAAGPSTDIRLDCGWPLNPPVNRQQRNPYLYTQMTIKF